MTAGKRPTPAAPCQPAAAEERTDDAFYAPWAHLSAAEVLAIRDDIVTLNQQLTSAA